MARGPQVAVISRIGRFDSPGRPPSSLLTAFHDGLSLDYRGVQAADSAAIVCLSSIDTF